MVPIQNPSIQEKIPKIIKLIADDIGAEGTDDLFPELKETDQNGMPIQPGMGQGIPPQQPQITPEMVQQMVQQAVEQALQGKDAEGKQAQNDLKSRELDIKERQMEADLVLRADKQAHDTNLSIHTATQPKEQAMPGETAPKKAEQTEETPSSGDYTDDELQFGEALMHSGFDEGSIEQAIVMKRQGMPVEQIIATLGAKAHAGR
jgi:hypothetical protein